jgi:c-di-GMP-related signal transduction protein
VQNFIARQPIVNRRQKTVAFELLFRDGIRNVFNFYDRDEATLRVMVNSLKLFGMRTVTGGRKAFINVTRDVLTKELVHQFPKALVIPEILEDIAEDEQTVAACIRLKTAGYQIALDDIVSLDDRNVIFQLADIVKVDFADTDREMQRSIAERFSGTPTQLLAEKVENEDEFERAKRLGYTLFQGYFFAKPEILFKRSFPGEFTRYAQAMAMV